MMQFPLDLLAYGQLLVFLLLRRNGFPFLLGLLVCFGSRQISQARIDACAGLIDCCGGISRH